MLPCKIIYSFFMDKGFEYPPYFFRLTAYLCEFVAENNNFTAKDVHVACSSFADYFATLLMTQAIQEIDYDTHEKILNFYNCEYFELSSTVIHLSEEMTSLNEPYLLKDKCKELEAFYTGDFNEFIKTFGNATEFICFTEKYFGIDKILRKLDFLYLLGLYNSESNRFRYLVDALRKLRLMKHPYDGESYKFIIETISKRVDIHVNYVAAILNINVNEWLGVGKKMKEEIERSKNTTTQRLINFDEIFE